MDDQQIHRLLQLKSHEQPSPEEIENFILEFHRRQEAYSPSPSLLGHLQERLAFFFSDFQIPRMAYLGATALALFCSYLILQTNTGSQEHNDPASSPLSADNFSAIHYYSAPIMQNEMQPVSFSLKKEKSETDALLSPMSLILKNRSSKEPLMSF